MPQFYIVCPINIFRHFFFWGGGGGGNPLLPISYAYGWAPGPPPAKSGPAENATGDEHKKLKISWKSLTNFFKFS